MSRTSIPVDEETKAHLDERKDEDETWDEFLRRIASSEEPINAGVLSEQEAEEMKDRVRENRRSLR